MAQKVIDEFLDKKMQETEKIDPEHLLFEYDGGLYPTMICCLETLKMLNTFRARREDVILVGYPKTGTNWVGQILTELEIASGKYDEEEQNWRNQKKQELSLLPYLEFGDPGKFERLEKLPSRRVIKTHLTPQKIPKSIFEKKAKILVLLRNPKDTAISYFHFANAMKLISDQVTWDKFFEDFINGKVPYGCYFNHIIEWNKYTDDNNVFFISYEELKENTTIALKKIAEFFDFSVTEEEIETTAERTSFKSMKENSSKTHGKFGNNFFRKGIVGDWKSVFSESQNEVMDRKFEENLAKTKLGMLLKYELYCKN